MSNYTKATNFATKDTLPTGDANKIVKGTEIDNEFNAISGAISSKSDTASPTFTGSPAAPTATAGSNTTQIATTAFVTAADVAERTSTTTLTNKTLTSPTINTPTITGGSITGITDLAVADGGTGQSSYTNGQLLIGNSTGNTLTKATLTAGSGVSITNGTGSITVASTVITASSNTATSGYVTFANGTIMQWGQATGISTRQSITFPIAFPTNVVSITAQAASTGTTGVESWSVNSYTTSGFEFVINNAGQTAFWFAVGY
jgi:hypothetical protein